MIKLSDLKFYVISLFLIVVFIMITGCVSRVDDTELQCELECEKCEKVSLSCKEVELVEKIKIGN